MYQCNDCNGLYDLSNENHKHIEKQIDHVIGADLDSYGDEIVYLMYGRTKKEGETFETVEGIKR